MPNDTHAPTIWSILQSDAAAVFSETHANEKVALWEAAEMTICRDTYSTLNRADAVDGNSHVPIAKSTLAIKGNSSGLFIDGHVEGIVAHHEKHLTVGKQGRVTGQVLASSVTVLGQVIGEIRSDGIVTLAKGADVEGDIFGERVLVEDGAKFKGQFNGEIRSDGIVTLAKGADVEGDIFCARVLIEDGANFKGKIDTGDSPEITVSTDPPQRKSGRSGKTGKVAA